MAAEVMLCRQRQGTPRGPRSARSSGPGDAGVQSRFDGSSTSQRRWSRYARASGRALVQDRRRSHQRQHAARTSAVRRRSLFRPTGRISSGWQAGRSPRDGPSPIAASCSPGRLSGWQVVSTPVKARPRRGYACSPTPTATRSACAAGGLGRAAAALAVPAWAVRWLNAGS